MTSVRAPTAALCLSAVLASGLVWAWALGARRLRARHAPVPVRAEAESVPGLSGEVALGDGMRFSVRIARLHQEPARQEFDAAALRRRFDLAEGEPFQCTLALGRAAADAHATRGVGLAQLRVEDGHGIALTTLPVPAERARADPADPLATLVAPPGESLAAGTSVSILLWGRAPLPRARFVLADAPPVEIAATELAPRDLDNALARIDALDAGAAGGTGGDQR